MSSQFSRRVGVRTAAIALASALVLAGAPGSAAAHVTVSSPDARPGGYAKLVFRVPTESDTARTTGLVVSLPADHPFASVSAQVKDGWKVVKSKRKLPTPIEAGDVTLTEAVTTVTWTAEAGGVPANDFDEFALSVGRLPEGVDSLAFPAVQTYSDGKSVRWDQPAGKGVEEPAKPAPTLKLTTALTPMAATTNPDGNGSDAVARVLGGAGLLLGLLGLGVALRSGRSRTVRP